MGDNDGVMQALGRIEGKLDAEISMAKEHREDDKRRFGDLYTKHNEHSQQIAEAKGAKKVIVFLIGGGAAAIGALVSWIGGRS